MSQTENQQDSSTHSNSESFTSFDKIDALIDVPSSSRKTKIVRLGAKVLETKKEVRKVLPEAQYLGNLEKIIVRDYFPELPKLKAQAEFIDAVARNDHLKIRELQIRYSTRRTDRRTSPSQRPNTSASLFDPATPLEKIKQEGEEGGDKIQGTGNAPYANEEGDNDAFLNGSNKKKKDSLPKKALDNFTVQTYLEKYTSEDNASFEELFELGKKRERVQNAWMYEAEAKHNESLVSRDQPMLEAADEQLVAKIGDSQKFGKREGCKLVNFGAKKHKIVNRLSDDQRPINVDNWSYKARNVVLFNHLDEAPLTMQEHIDRAKTSEIHINKKGTRFKNEQQKAPDQVAMARAAFQNVSKIAGHVDVTGKQVGIESKTIGLVATPTPIPDESPLMTWGEIEGTPFRLDAPEIQPHIENAPTFKIPEMPVREKVAAQIAEKIASSYNNKRKLAMNKIQEIAPKTPKFNASCRSGTSRVGTMSPAARTLLNERLGIRLGTDKLIKFSPSPRGTPTSRTMFSPSIYKLVKPKSEANSGASTPSRLPESNKSTTTINVTDNLLNIPPAAFGNDNGGLSSATSSGGGRPKAADFF
uniref:Uncharacterized protein n=1 Tax=Meloidogyne javanica TaxID=6303 RepID=A0A915LL26_MELJA